MADRPLVAIPARFSGSASALRYEAEVGARALIAAVHAAGGEPWLMHPHAPGGVADDAEVAARLARADAVLLPGGGDLAAEWYSAETAATSYDVDPEQDAFDLAVARVALERRVPTLAICRGAQAVNVVLGGDLVQDMPGRDHRHVRQTLAVPAEAAPIFGADPLDISCYHHQMLGRLGDGVRVLLRTEDGVPEAYDLPGHPGYFLAVQWHPEDTAGTDPRQLALFRSMVTATTVVHA